MAFYLILTVKPTFKFMQRQQSKFHIVLRFQIYRKHFIIDSSELQGDKLVKFAL